MTKEDNEDANKDMACSKVHQDGVNRVSFSDMSLLLLHYGLCSEADIGSTGKIQISSAPKLRRLAWCMRRTYVSYVEDADVRSELPILHSAYDVS